MRDDHHDAGVSVAVIAPDGLALLCTGQGYTGHTVKTVYTSGNLGATWIKAGVPSSPDILPEEHASHPTRLTLACTIIGVGFLELVIPACPARQSPAFACGRCGGCRVNFPAWDLRPFLPAAHAP